MPIYKMQGKKNGLQKYRVRINYKDSAGNYKQFDRVTYGMAEAQFLESSLMQKAPTKTLRMTLNELHEEYYAVKKAELRESTIETALKIYNIRIKPLLGDVQIRNITPKLLQSWKMQLSEKELAISTKQHAYAELRALLIYAIKMEYITKNPLKSIDNFKESNFSKPQDVIHFYTPEQFLKFINTAKENLNTFIDFGCCVFFYIAFYTGMRKGEINALKWSDIDNNIIHVRRSITQKLKNGDVETPPKNKSSYRDIQIPKSLIAILENHKQLQINTFTNFSNDFRVCGAIRCLRDTTIDKFNRRHSALAELPHIRIHDFRHSHATLLANEGINIQEVARRLGHSNIVMTWNTYSHLYPREEERAISILDKII